jgi:hypothetical protein
MALESYFVRIVSSHDSKFCDVLRKLNIEYQLSTFDFGTALYSVNMDREQALRLKLTFPIVGIMKNG